jgi:hypothetical protein
MLKTFLLLLVSGMLLIGVAVQPAMAAPSANPQVGTEQVKSKIARLGVGAKAKVTVWLANGTKIKGYIAQAGDDDFVVRDRKTDAPTTIRYADVSKVDSNRGHSMARNIGIGVAVGAGAVLAVIAILVAAWDD